MYTFLTGHKSPYLFLIGTITLPFFFYLLCKLKHSSICPPFFTKQTNIDINITHPMFQTQNDIMM